MPPPNIVGLNNGVPQPHGDGANRDNAGHAFVGRGRRLGPGIFSHRVQFRVSLPAWGCLLLVIYLLAALGLAFRMVQDPKFVRSALTGVTIPDQTPVTQLQSIPEPTSGHLGRQDGEKAVVMGEEGWSCSTDGRGIKNQANMDESGEEDGDDGDGDDDSMIIAEFCLLNVRVGNITGQKWEDVDLERFVESGGLYSAHDASSTTSPDQHEQGQQQRHPQDDRDHQWGDWAKTKGKGKARKGNREDAAAPLGQISESLCKACLHNAKLQQKDLTTERQALLESVMLLWRDDDLRKLYRLKRQDLDEECPRIWKKNGTGKGKTAH